MGRGAWLPLSASLNRFELGCSVLGSALFHEPLVASGCGGVVIVRDIEFASTSEADLLPFYGRCHIGYVPSRGVVLGLSKVARLARMYARRLQTQERFTQELLQAFEAHVHPQVTTACFPRTLLLRLAWKLGHKATRAHADTGLAFLQGCAVLVEARHLSQGPEQPVYASSAASGCLRQKDRMQVSAFEPSRWCMALAPCGAPLAPQLANLGTNCSQEFLTLLRLHAPAAPLPSPDCTRSSSAFQADSSNGSECGGEHLAREPSGACQSGKDGLSLPAQEHMERAVESILCEIGEDPARPVRALVSRSSCAALPCGVRCLLVLHLSTCSAATSL